MQTYTGQYGFVFLLPEHLHQDIKELKEEYPNNKIHFAFEGGIHIPHITIYHTHVTNAPREEIQALHKKLQTLLPLNITLEHISTFGNHFAFWNVELNTKLKDIHEQSLALSKYYTERQTPKQTLENISPETQHDLEQYGYIFVKEHWKPHITLAYTEDSIPLPKTNVHKKQATIDAVAFVRIGDAGTVVELMKI